jgi:signal transduction histidine kinase
MTEAQAKREIARLQGEVAQLRRQLDAVHTISSALSSIVDLDEMLRETLEVSLRTVGANAGSLYLYDPETDEVVFRYVVGDKANILTGMRIKADQGIAGEVFQTGIPMITRDVTQDQHHLTTVDQQTQYVTRNMVTVPLKSIEGAPIGVMQVLNKEKGTFDEQDLELLSIMGAQAAAAIESQRLYEDAKLAVVVNMMGDISHDIKNMITPVQTCVQTLEYMCDRMWADIDQVMREHADGDPEALAKIRRACEPLRSFMPDAVEMCLDGSLAVQDRVREIADCVKGIVSEPHFELASVNDVIRKVVQPLSLVAEKAGVHLRTDGLGDIPDTLIDQKQIYNAIYNLINNAIPETPAGGEIRVSTSAVTEGEFPNGRYILIQVADTGRGIPEHVRAKLFTDQAVSTKPGGTGLGTRIVKNVVDAHHGHVWVESQEGKGSRFYIRLPIASEVGTQ